MRDSINHDSAPHSLQPTELKQAPAIAVFACGFVALLFPKAVAPFLARTDHVRELKSNEQLRKSDYKRRDESYQRLIEATTHRFRLLRRMVVTSFLSMASAVVVSVGAEATLPSAIGDAQGPLTLASLFSFAWATLSRLGWAGQTFSGRTVTERLDQLLFHTLYWLGMSLGALAIL